MSNQTGSTETEKDTGMVDANRRTALSAFEASSTGGGFVALFKKYGDIQVMVACAEDETRLPREGEKVGISFSRGDSGETLEGGVDALEWEQAEPFIRAHVDKLLDAAKTRRTVLLPDGFAGNTVAFYVDPIEVDGHLWKLGCAEAGREYLITWARAGEVAAADRLQNPNQERIDVQMNQEQERKRIAMTDKDWSIRTNSDGSIGEADNGVLLVPPDDRNPVGNVLKTFESGEKFDCKLGDPVIANGYRGMIEEVCSGQLSGMVVVRLPSVAVCVDCSYPDCYPAVWNGVEVVTEGRHVGTVSEVNGQFVAQATGRGKVVAHEITRLAVTPKVGDALDVQYRSGQAVVADGKNKGIER